MLTAHQHDRDVLADVFRMRAFIDIWGFVVRKRFNKPFYTRELVNEAKVDPRIAHTWIKDHSRNGIIRTDVKAGRTKFYRLNFENMLTQKIVELVLAAESEAMQKSDEFLAAVVQEAKERSATEATEQRILLMVLYGSQARKTASKGSDVDLFFVIQDEKGEGKRKIRELCDMMSDRYSRKIEPVTVAEKQFTKMLKGPEAFIINVMRDGVPLYGLEYYVICRSSAKTL